VVSFSLFSFLFDSLLPFVSAAKAVKETKEGIKEGADAEQIFKGTKT